MLVCVNYPWGNNLAIRIPAIAVFAILCGIAAYYLMEVVLKVITPFLGGYMFTAGVCFLGRVYLEWWETSPFDPSAGAEGFFGRVAATHFICFVLALSPNV